MSRGGSTLGSVAGVLVAATLGAPAPALAQAAIRWDAPCGERATFAGQVAELGGSVDGFDVDVTVREAEAGRFHGRLTIRRDAQPLVTRELDDERCADVLDALAIAAALALRALPRPPEDPDVVRAAEPVASPDPDAAADDAQLAPPLPVEPGAVPRLALGASVRGGLGPTPGAAIAPAVIVALVHDRLLAALAVAYWPESGATREGGAGGVALWALGASVEVGYRIGDRLSVVPCVAAELSVAFARGVDVARPRSGATAAFDAGAAVWLTLDVGSGVQLFARGELLFGIVRPAYGVEGEVVFAGPEVRGTGAAGVLLIL